MGGEEGGGGGEAKVKTREELVSLAIKETS